VAGVTDTGRKRRRNEDSFVVAPPLFAVADGMGGAQAGEVASKLAASSLREAEDELAGGEERVIALIQEANRRVYSRAVEDPAASGMGTTMTVALVENGGVVIGHVGDSRAYRVREGRLEQLTDDHSLVNELMKSGKLSAEEAETHPQRSVITRALGTDPDVDVDAFTVEAHDGDVYLLCSDGLTTMVDDDRILDVLEHHRGDLDRAARTLVSEANRGGGEDNITVVAFELATGGDGDETLKLPAQHVPDEEDTLDGIPVPPPVDTAVVPPDQVERALAEYEANPPEATEHKPSSRGARFRLAGAMVLLFAVAAGLVVWGLLR
jgi:protein phosphatase